MVFGLFRRRAGSPAQALYGAIVAASRRPAFYLDAQVPDTVDGRFDLVVLHLALVVRRLNRDGEAGRALSQAAFDAFLADMDGNLREMGVGDLGVPGKMRRLGEAFYGRLGVYDEALNAGDEAALAAALARNVFGDVEAGQGARRLAAYMRAAARALDAQETAALADGHVTFPEAEANVCS